MTLRTGDIVTLVAKFRQRLMSRSELTTMTIGDVRLICDMLSDVLHDYVKGGETGERSPPQMPDDAA